MRVLVLGQTGVEKRRFIAALVAHARKQRELPESDSDQYATRYLRAFHIEDEIKDFTHNATIQPFLDNLDAEARLRTWQDVMTQRVLQPLEESPSEHVLLSMHAFFYRNNNFFTPIDWSLLSKFGPDVVVTLVDDAYDVASRVTIARETRGPKTQSTLTVAEALVWRSAEVSTADLLARSLGVPNFVLPVKHPVETAYRLLFRRDIIRVYLSFPISSTRRVPDRVAEINEHRFLVHQKYTAFDPVCVDELRMTHLADQGDKWELADRWMLDPVTPTIPVEGDFAKDLAAELRTLEAVIRNQIEERDYRLIDQADIIVAYRPFWGGVEYPAQGVEKEISQAVAKNKTVYYFDPPEDNLARKSRAFRVIERGIRFETVANLYSELAKFQETRMANFGGGATCFTKPA